MKEAERPFHIIQFTTLTGRYFCPHGKKSVIDYLVAVRDNRSLPPLPTVYLLYHWRQVMHTSWNEAMETPLHVILQDIEMAQLEATYRKPQGE